MIKRYAPNAPDVEAMLIEENNLQEAAEWCGGEVRPGKVLIPSIEGGKWASLGEYLVKIKNKFEAWSAVRFELDYHEVGKRQDGLQWRDSGPPPFTGGVFNSRSRGSDHIGPYGSGVMFGE